MGVNGIGGPRNTFNVAPQGQVSYPQLRNPDIGTYQGPNTRHTTRPGGPNGGPQGGIQNELKMLGKLLQVLGQLFQMLGKLFGGGQQAPGASSPGAAPGASSPGGTSSSPDTSGSPSSMPDLTGGNPVGAVGSAPGGAGNIPYISQYSPAGAQNGYSNGSANCGPTSIAMIARAKGYGANMTDAQLINHLGAVGGTTGAGSSINGIVAMAHEIGANAEVHGPHADLNWIDQKLASGATVTANGDYFAEPGHNGGGRQSGHYLDVVGKDGNGNYLIRDPADQSEHAFTPQQLAQFINANPVNGGYCVAVS